MTVSSARAAVAGAKVRVTGPGMRARAKVTNAAGRATFTVKPTRRGRITIRSAKAGFNPATVTLAVRVQRAR